MQAYLADNSSVTSLSLTAKDWEMIFPFLNEDDMWDLLKHELRIAFRVVSPPTGNTLVPVTTLTVSIATHLYLLVYGNTAVNNFSYNRVKVVYTTAGTTNTVITAMLAAHTTIINNGEQTVRIRGRKKLRGNDTA